MSLLALAVAAGTFVESRYDQNTANKLVYHSYWMALLLLALGLNLFMVLVSRWPWKRRHFPFVLAHIGLLITLIGAFVTRKSGVDGSMRLKEGESKEEILLPLEEIAIYSSYDGLSFTRVFREDVDFFRLGLTKTRPYKISGTEFAIEDYMPFALPRPDYRPARKAGAPVVRFLLEGAALRKSGWIDLLSQKETAYQNLGPARIILTKDPHLPLGAKDLVLYVDGKGRLWRRLQGGGKKKISFGRDFPTGWMDFRFRLLEFFPRGERFLYF